MLEIIARKIVDVAHANTVTPSTAKSTFESVFSEIVTGDAEFDAVSGQLMSFSGTIYHYREDESNIDEMVSMVRNMGDGLSLPSNGPQVSRRFRIVPSSGGKYKYVQDQHKVPYVLCHLKGFNKYTIDGGPSSMKGKNDAAIAATTSLSLHRYVEGRDIIYISVLWSAEQMVEIFKKMYKERLING